MLFDTGALSVLTIISIIIAIASLFSIAPDLGKCFCFLVSLSILKKGVFVCWERMESMLVFL